MAEITAAHDAIDRRTRRAVRATLKLVDQAGMRMDVQALLRATICDELHAVADLAHTMLDTVADDDMVLNDLYIDALEPRVANGC